MEFDPSLWSPGLAQPDDALAELELLLAQDALAAPADAAGPPTKLKRLKSCAPCRIRRVKCDRTGDGTGDCTKCIEKALVCTPMPTRTPRHGARTGKRIDQARAAFGTKVDPNRDPVLVPPGALAAATSTDLPTGDPILARLQINQRSAISHRLAGSELQAAVSASLLEFYLTNQPPVPLVECTSFRDTFNKAGRRLESLDPQSQVLYSLIIALGARNSDHPALVGPNAPSVDTLSAAAREGRDLREFGRRREDACRVLKDQAIELADRMGTLRLASPENIASLMLLESMVEQEDLTHSIVRPFVSAYHAHARTLLESGTLISGTLIGWTAYLRDALRSAATGHSPLFSDDDVVMLTSGINKPLPLEEATRAHQSVDPEADFWLLMGAFMINFGEFTRTIAARLTSLKARSAPCLDEAFVAEYLSFLDVSWRALAELEARSALFTPTPVRGRQVNTVAGTVRSMAVSTCNLTFRLNRALGERISAKWENPPSPSTTGIRELDARSPESPQEDDTYWTRLVELRKETYSRAFLASRKIVRICGDVLNQGISLGTMEWLDNRAAQHLFATLPAWLSGIVDTPTTEEGGPSGFTAQMSLYSIGWARERLTRPVSWVEEEIAKLEVRRSAFWTRPMPPYHSSSSSSQPDPELLLADSLLNSVDLGQHPFEGFDLNLLDPFLSQAPGFAMQVKQQEYTEAEIQMILGAVSADLSAFEEGGIFASLGEASGAWGAE